MFNIEDVYREVEITSGFRPGYKDGRPCLIGWGRSVTTNTRTGAYISIRVWETGVVIYQDEPPKKRLWEGIKWRQHNDH